MATAAVYLEQYLDSLDSLPDEMKDKFEKLRELDQKVMDDHKKAEAKKMALFKDLKSGRKMEDNEKKKRITEIQSLFRSCNSISDQKCQLASQAYELIDKHIRKLDTELARFEGELKQQQMDNLTSSPTNTASNRSSENQVSGSRAHKNTTASGGRSVSSQNSSADAGKKKRKNTEASGTDSNVTANKKSNLKESRSESVNNMNASGAAPAILGLPEMIGGSVDVLDMPVDPNEPTYCICQQVSYGEMIGCDNQDCPIEWFHFNCVGLSAKPKGKWFCARCSAERKKKLTSNI